VKNAVKTVAEIVRLAIAVFVYVRIEPSFIDFFPKGLEFWAQAAAALVGAGLTFLLLWLVVPFSTVALTFTNYATRVAIDGPTIEMNVAPHTKNFARYDVNYEFASGGLIARWIARCAVKRGLALDLEFPIVEVLTENGDSTDVGKVTRVKLEGALPNNDLWVWTSLSFSTLDVPTNARPRVIRTLNVSGGTKFQWFYRIFIRTTSTVSKLHIVRT
jgi:hypothetical protein